MKRYNFLQVIIRTTTLIILLTAIISSFMVYDTPMNQNKGGVLLFISIAGGILLVGETVLFWDKSKKMIAKLSSQISKTERDSLLNFPAPVIIIDDDGVIMWYNRLFGKNVYQTDEAYGLKLSDIVNIDMEKCFSSNGDLICIDHKFYRAKAIHNNATGVLTMIYFNDVSDYVELEYENRQSHKSVIIIMIDNYDDLLSNLRESEKAHALVEIEKLIENNGCF